MLEFYKEHLSDIIRVAFNTLTPEDQNKLVRHVLELLSGILIDNYNKS